MLFFSSFPLGINILYELICLVISLLRNVFSQSLFSTAAFNYHTVGDMGKLEHTLNCRGCNEGKQTRPGWGTRQNSLPQEGIILLTFMIWFTSIFLQNLPPTPAVLLFHTN